jgi:hypothetical protein
MPPPDFEVEKKLGKLLSDDFVKAQEEFFRDHPNISKIQKAMVIAFAMANIMGEFKKTL